MQSAKQSVSLTFFHQAAMQTVIGHRYTTQQYMSSRDIIIKETEHEHSTAQHIAIQHSTAQHDTAQHNTAQQPPVLFN
jgi:hypothetical protein